MQAVVKTEDRKNKISDITYNCGTHIVWKHNGVVPQDMHNYLELIIFANKKTAMQRWSTDNYNYRSSNLFNSKLAHVFKWRIITRKIIVFLFVSYTYSYLWVTEPLFKHFERILFFYIPLLLCLFCKLIIYLDPKLVIVMTQMLLPVLMPVILYSTLDNYYYVVENKFQVNQNWFCNVWGMYQ